MPSVTKDRAAGILAQALIRTRQAREIRQQFTDLGAERSSLAAFLPQVYKTDKGLPAFPPAHIRDIVLPALEDDSLGDTVIIAPPGSAKTNTLMAFTAHSLGVDPAQHFGYFSSTDGQAFTRSVSIRDTVSQSAMYRAIFPDVAPDRQKGWGEREWFLRRGDVSDKDPSLKAAGTGTAIQGARLNRINLDDVADRSNMATPYQRQKVIDWITNDVMTRRTPGARSIMICTRWHDADPAAWAIAQGWHVIHIAAVNEDGSSYWPEHWPIQMLACPKDDHGYAVGHRRGADDQTICWEERDATGKLTGAGPCAKLFYGSRQFGLIYQGETVDDASSHLKRQWWQWYDPAALPASIRLLLDQPLEKGDKAEGSARGAILVDMAHEEKTTADYSCALAAAAVGPSIYFLDLFHDRVEFPELERALINFRAKWKLPIVIEKTPGSTPLIQRLRRVLTGVIPWPIMGRSKMARVEATAPTVEAGNVYLPIGAPWAYDLIEECARFGQGGAHDDIVDVVTMALMRLNRRSIRPL